MRFENPPQQVEVKTGQTARLTCQFTGSPPLVSCWIRNKEQVYLLLTKKSLSLSVSSSNLLFFLPLYIAISQIVDGSKFWTENTDQSSTLVIEEVTPHHAGSYSIVVRDRKTSAQHTLTLSVIGKLSQGQDISRD